jgi:hypothetical protein
MVRRHLSLPHRFICVTNVEAPWGNLDIETVELDLDKHVPGTCFCRLVMRRPDWGTVLGGAKRIFNLDLDVVIVDSIDSIVDRSEPSVFFRNPNFPKPRRAFYQGSIQLFDAGSHAELYHDFDPASTPNWLNWRFGGAEQAWISERLPWTLPYWDKRDGIYGAGRIGDWRSGAEATLPAGAKLVTFPGARIPDQPEVMKKHAWIEEHYR